MLLNRIENVTMEEERVVLAGKSMRRKYTATLLPIKTVDVQGDSLLISVHLVRYSSGVLVCNMEC